MKETSGSGEGLKIDPPYHAAASWPWRVALAAASALALALAHPNAEQGWLAWLALTPLLLAVDGLSRRAAAALGLGFGFGNAVLVYHWMLALDGFGIHHALILGIYLALYPALFCVGIASCNRSRLPCLLALPSLWVALEFVRGHAGFLAFPWATLAHTQANTPHWLQLAAITGEAGVSFLIVLVNCALALLLMRRSRKGERLAVALVLILAFLGGAYAADRPIHGAELRVAVIQPNIPLDDPKTPAGLKARFEKLKRLTMDASALGVDLVVWPETAVRNLTKTPALQAGILELATRLDVSLIIGASDAEKLQPATQEHDAAIEFHNSAYHALPNRPLGMPYHKMHLLPFGEYQPFNGRLTWPDWLAPKLFDIQAGRTRTKFRLRDGTQFGILICWENLFADATRLWVIDGARLLVHISNDNWFGPTAEPRQHYAASVLRAVETGVPVVIASNTGPSQIIDARGRRISELSNLFKEGHLVAVVTIPASTSPYTNLGNFFSWFCVGIATLHLLWKRPLAIH